MFPSRKTPVEESARNLKIDDIGDTNWSYFHLVRETAQMESYFIFYYKTTIYQMFSTSLFFAGFKALFYFVIRSKF